MNILVDLANVPPIPIPLGKDEQNAFNTVIFDARAWGADFPGATYTVLYQRPTGDIYPVLVNQPGPLISWTPSAADTTIVPNAPAFARAEIRLMQGDALGKSATAVFGLTAGILSEAPAAPTPDWVTTVAQDAAKAEAAVAHYPQLIDGDLWIWNPTSEQWEKLIISEGGNPNAVLFTEQTLSATQKAQARSNIDAATPSDIPSVPEMATSPTMTDWTSGKTLDAGAAKDALNEKANTDDVPTEVLRYASQNLTDAQKAQARANINAASMADLGTVFTLKGGVATVADLPQTGNRIGDVWYVENLSAGFIWITSTAYPNGYWEELGETIDMSAYIEKPANPQTGYVITWNGSAWIAQAVPKELPAVTAADNGKVLGVVNGAWAVKSDEGGASVTVDDALSTTSENPVQNKVVKAAFNERDGLMQKCQIVTEASENRWDKDSASIGLLGLDGQLYTGGSYDNYCYYNIGNVREGDVITSYKKQNTAVDDASMMRVVCYDSGGNAVVSAGTSTATQSFTVPSGVASVAICTTKNTGLTYNYMVLVNAEAAPTDYIPYIEHNVFYRATEDFLPRTSRLDKVNTLLGSDSPTVSAATLASGTALTLTDAPYFIKKNVTVSARMEFETFASVEVGKGQNSYRGKSVIVDGTSITQVSYNDSGTAVNGSVVAHGLTISDYLQVTMFMGDDGKCEVTINTTSGTFATTFDFFAEWNYSPFVVGAQAMTDVQLGFSCSDIRCPMWVFGDSYIGLYDNRVGGQLRQLGFFNFALVGVAGGRANDGSKATYPDLQRMLALGTPKYIVWTLGMNGGDAANIAFLPTLIALCEDKGIELILYKVPHIPTIDHSTLNAYIESTGLRYIDACAAVGATTAGVWYTGMLSNDEVHPSALGATAIAMRYLTDCPEIMQYGKAETVLPSGGTTGDFLRKTAYGVAWETVQTYQGGSY